MRRWSLAFFMAAAAAAIVVPARAAGPAFVDLTWLSISNIYAEMGPLKVMIDGYITRLPESAFFGGGGGLANTRQAFVPDEPAIRDVLNALGGSTSINLLLTGHSHFDHSFDTATWSRLTGARIMGPQTTCLQAQAQGIPADRCKAVVGREVIQLADGITMHVIRWNHSGDPATNPEQHNAVELTAVPSAAPGAAGLRAGVAEDFPNGGGNRAYLFVIDGPSGKFSWLFQNSGSPVDLGTPIVIDGVDYGAPIENLKAAMTASGLPRVDVWVGSGGASIARAVLPVIRPRAYLPVHWDGLWSPFRAGVPRPFADPGLEAALRAAGTELVRPRQYTDKWRVDASGIQPVPNDKVRSALGFTAGPAPR